MKDITMDQVAHSELLMGLMCFLEGINLKERVETAMKYAYDNGFLAGAEKSVGDTWTFQDRLTAVKKYIAETPFTLPVDVSYIEYIQDCLKQKITPGDYKHFQTLVHMAAEKYANNKKTIIQ